MRYLLFNDDILISDGKIVERIAKGPGLKDELDSRWRGDDKDNEKARLCYVDVDVMIASAPQDHVDKKDSILAQKFEELYSGEYITLNEKIDNNIFQVIGIKGEKIKEIYSLVPSPMVDAFVPYAVAIRGLLADRHADMTRSIVFVDDLGDEKLVTVFEGLKFSRTRTINTAKAEDILSDIKRSHIDFNKKLGEFAGNKATGDLTVITNNKQLADDIRFSEPNLAVDFLDCRYPALEGLKSTDTQFKYRIHEEIILERKKKALRSRLICLVISLGLCLAGVLFWGYYQFTYSNISREFEGENRKSSQLKDALALLDQQVYRDVLKKSKNLNYSSVFFEVSGLLPSTYAISSFKFSNLEGHWVFDTYIFAQDDQFYDEIPRSRILKNAEIKDFFIKNRPGKYLKVVL